MRNRPQRGVIEKVQESFPTFTRVISGAIQLTVWLTVGFLKIVWQRLSGRFDAKLVQDKVLLSLVPPLFLVGMAGVFLILGGNAKFAELIPPWICFGLAGIFLLVGSAKWEGREWPYRMVEKDGKSLKIEKRWWPPCRAAIRVMLIVTAVAGVNYATHLVSDPTQEGLTELAQMGVYPPQTVVVHVKDLVATRDRQIFFRGPGKLDYESHVAPEFSVWVLQSPHQHKADQGFVRLDLLGWNPPLPEAQGTKRARELATEARKLSFMWSILDHMKAGGMKFDEEKKSFVEKSIQVFMVKACGALPKCTPDGQVSTWTSPGTPQPGQQHTP